MVIFMWHLVLLYCLKLPGLSLLCTLHSGPDWLGVMPPLFRTLLTFTLFWVFIRRLYLQNIYIICSMYIWDLRVMLKGPIAAAASVWQWWGLNRQPSDFESGAFRWPKAGVCFSFGSMQDIAVVVQRSAGMRRKVTVGGAECPRVLSGRCFSLRFWWRSIFNNKRC